MKGINNYQSFFDIAKEGECSICSEQAGPPISSSSLTLAGP
jgi:hypothetical protein